MEIHLTQLENLKLQAEKPYNPMINAGAIAVASMIKGKMKKKDLVDY